MILKDIDTDILKDLMEIAKLIIEVLVLLATYLTSKSKNKGKSFPLPSYIITKKKGKTI